MALRLQQQHHHQQHTNHLEEQTHWMAYLPNALQTVCCAAALPDTGDGWWIRELFSGICHFPGIPRPRMVVTHSLSLSTSRFLGNIKHHLTLGVESKLCGTLQTAKISKTHTTIITIKFDIALKRNVACTTMCLHFCNCEYMQHTITLYRAMSSRNRLLLPADSLINI